MGYYYGVQSEQYAFYRIPKLLVSDSRFKQMSTESKLLYGMLIDRMELSRNNKWIDDDGRVYIYFTIDNVCGRITAWRSLSTLSATRTITRL